RTALGLGAAGALFAVGGAVLSEFVDGRVLMLLTALLMLWSGISVARGGRRGPAPVGPTVDAVPDAAERVESAPAARTTATTTVLRDVPRHSLGTIAGLGAVAGFVAGLLGVGGGIVMVPMLTGPLKFPVRAATASSLVAVAIFSLPALVTHAVLGHINWFFASALMLGVVPGAQVGASLTIRSSERTIRLAFGGFIVLMALVFAATQVLAGR
ncbi:MAG: sulfite exporter TauE/SafE family protein, partial [Actinomycetes bacterium]